MLGFTASGAANGVEALELLSNAELPSLILLDLMMPIINVVEFRNKQREDQRIANIPLVVMSADGNAKQKALRLNVEDGLAKPIDLDVLQKIAERYCTAPFS